MAPEFLAPEGYVGYFHYAKKKGYSGVGAYTRLEPSDVVVGFDGGRDPLHSGYQAFVGGP